MTRNDCSSAHDWHPRGYSFDFGKKEEQTNTIQNACSTRELPQWRKWEEPGGKWVCG